MLFEQLMSDREMLEMLETELNDSTNISVLNMNDIERSQRYKPYLKKLILENIADVHFTRPPDKTKPEQILSAKVTETLLARAHVFDPNDLREDVIVLIKAAKIFRREIATTMEV